MSHFTVLVVGKDPEEQLKPFQENNMGDCPKEYLTFHDTETESLEEYETKTRKMYQSPSGERFSTWDERFRVKGIGTGSDTHAKPADYIEVEVPFKEIFATFEDYMSEWHGSSARDPETGRYGYWENPNAKWDWYQLGGRWAGSFRLKEGVSVAARGEQSWMQRMQGVPYPEGSADQAYKGDIDFDAMRAEKEAKAGERYDKIHAVIAGRTVKSWDDILSFHGKEHIEHARKEYGMQDVVMDLDKERLLDWDEKAEDFVNVSREDFVLDARNGAVSTFAVLKDGVWYERGRMGWWGIVHGDVAETEWNAQFAKLLDEVPDDTLLSVYDCHI